MEKPNDGDSEHRSDMDSNDNPFPSACGISSFYNGVALVPRIPNPEEANEEIWNVASDQAVMNLLQFGPVGAAIAAASYDTDRSRAIWANYEKGIMGEDACPHLPNGQELPVNHAVLLVGYGTDQNGIDYWKLKVRIRGLDSPSLMHDMTERNRNRNADAFS